MVSLEAEVFFFLAFPFVSPFGIVVEVLLGASRGGWREEEEEEEEEEVTNE